MQIPLETTVDGFNAEKEHILHGKEYETSTFNTLMGINRMSTVDYFTNFAIFSKHCGDFSDVPS